ELPLPGGAVQDVWMPPAPPPPPGRPTRRAAWWPRARRAALLTVVAVVVAAVLTGGAGWWLGTAGRARVPTLVGLDRPAAEQAIARARLKVAYDPSTYSDTFAKDTVVSSTPRAGVPVGRGSTVRLRLSLGPQRPRVPRVAGLSENDARAALGRPRLTVAGVSQTYDDTAAAGTVVRTDPAEGTVLDPGGAVSLVVSAGRAPVQVPDVADASPEDATRQLEGAGLVVRHAEAHDPTDAGEVARTEPAAGTPVPRGSTVTMVVSLGEDLVTVPDVGDMSARKARKLLESRGFTVRVVAVPGLDSRIVATNPGAGAQVPRGSTVTIFAV
ncbi:MAG TPA: PASTA domain-containing protein, partial [Frankiaceae bacterium]|nr:PASTA domain-containing protein [Frankiaceae bacterium]